ncbi:glycoside hydrolase [Ruminococcaceae bacterium OttesenSCG-928-D13]|nr:glycoside hydrolase [Ruminococcaceae bacterium OttesenSCG-928-D13]
MARNDPATCPAVLYPAPEAPRFSDSVRRWQGVPSIAVSGRGRIFVNFYAGQMPETGGNFMLLLSSDDGGISFIPRLAVEHPDSACRIFDPALWTDPRGRLWVFWAQARGFNDGRAGVWCSVCARPDDATPVWGAPRRIANGIMLNKPIVDSAGRWLLPCALWRDGCGAPPTEDHGLDSQKFSNVVCSEDEGEHFYLLGSADVPNRGFDEHMLVERGDGSLWMLVRCLDGIGESFSSDGGRHWSTGRKSAIEGPCSRFFIGRLQSGRLLMVNHHGFGERLGVEEIMAQGDVKCWKGRTHLTALLSEDDGLTWPYALLLDVRNDAAYPDAAQAPDGSICICYDWERVRHRQILMARITEADILAGQMVSPESALRLVVSQALGKPDVE